MNFNKLSNLWFSLLSAACLGVGVLLWAVQSWAAPYLPLVFGALGAGAIFLIVLKSEPTQTSPATPDPAGHNGRVDRATLVQAGPLILAVLVCALWLVAPIRFAAASAASKLNILPMSAMQTDPDPGVRAAVCRQVLRSLPLGERDALVDYFYASEDLRAQCLKPELEANNPVAVWVGNSVAQRWRNDLRAPDAQRSDAQACQAAAQLVGLGRADDRVQLLQYALGAESPGARKCFRDALGDVADISLLVGEPAALSPEVADALLEPMTQQVFFDKSGAEMVWSSPENQRWVWSLGCQMASSPSPLSQRYASASLESMAYQLSCGWAPGTSSDTLSTVRWANLCPDLQEALVSGPGPDALCPVLMPYLVDISVEYAKGMVAAAVSRFSMRTSATKIVNTPVGAGRAPTKEEAARAKLLKLTGSQIFGNYNPPEPIGCQDMMMQIFRGDDRAQASDAFARIAGSGELDCGPRPHEKTLGENQARLDKMRATKNPTFDTYIDRRYLDKSYGKADVDAALKRLNARIKK